ncbi:30S ribosomal protein S12 methylthiotransferase RimO [Desulfocurvus sp.]|jgi:tRNA-2-methylthio-N6-dimethylallyladenosine synthase/ribosomal protein S12 methylthiotransferase|uniref:30S ribosomal protein S12 methylthiotransferase RimO n=1 Tax=Desulfocurvus sp. TaxID=2871698 RepID=UPI0025B7BFEE|nr:30S ribosomal protein S12 methylthiotransferase RimO [Desulfocurvus sp.]MCK9240562.1 30S ribosomal protein S12 methylthiotransferase RimO [Desulfocurvus sp.]
MQRITVHSLSLGCPKNRVDTEGLLACLGPGLTPCDDPAAADVVLVNTCGFIAPAVEESVNAILDLAQAIEAAEPRPLLAVVGCLVGRYGDELAREIPEVDLWLPTRELHRWPERIAAALGRELPAPPPPGRVLSTGPAYAYLKVAEGCDHRCSFCTIPGIRGPLVSRPVQAIRDEARALLASGVRELVLVAQDLTAWGRDLGEPRGLSAVLEALLPLPGLDWLRPMYLYPGGLTPELLDFMRQAGPPLVPYFDIPLQHAHPDILKSMGRPFANDPRRVVERVRERFPEAALRTSLIVGYPGETEAHFQALMDFAAQARFHHLGVFGYCDEEGTRAHGLPAKVPEAVVARRRAALMEQQARISADILAGYEDTAQRVLVERAHDEWPGLHVGRCWFQAPEADGVTYISGEGVAPGALVEATIHEAQTYDLVALA